MTTGPWTEKEHPLVGECSFGEAEDSFLAWHQPRAESEPPASAVVQTWVTLLGVLHVHQGGESRGMAAQGHASCGHGQTYSILVEKLSLLQWKQIQKVQT